MVEFQQRSERKRRKCVYPPIERGATLEVTLPQAKQSQPPPGQAKQAACR